MAMRSFYRKGVVNNWEKQYSIPQSDRTVLFRDPDRDTLKGIVQEV